MLLKNLNSLLQYEARASHDFMSQMLGLLEESFRMLEIVAGSCKEMSAFEESRQIPVEPIDSKKFIAFFCKFMATAGDSEDHFITHHKAPAVFRPDAEAYGYGVYFSLLFSSCMGGGHS